MDIVNDERLSAIIHGAGKMVVLSPHLDDAVLSCGGLLASLGERAHVITAFSEGSVGPHTPAGTMFLRSCGAKDSPDLYRRRRAEDAEVLASLGASNENLGYSDALYRRRRDRLPGSRWAGGRFPKLGHRYPTFSKDIAVGKVARGDRELVPEIAREIDVASARVGSEIVLCPAGVGRHVDHLLMREVGTRLSSPIAFYSDFPYSMTSGIDRLFSDRYDLVGRMFEGDIGRKLDAIKGYRTQLEVLFPSGSVEAGPDNYFVTAG